MSNKKIYLSAAAHATDNPTKCKDKCGENIHCNAYMDIVEKRLKIWYNRAINRKEVCYEKEDNHRYSCSR